MARRTVVRSEATMARRAVVAWHWVLWLAPKPLHPVQCINELLKEVLRKRRKRPLFLIFLLRRRLKTFTPKEQLNKNKTLKSKALPRRHSHGTSSRKDLGVGSSLRFSKRSPESTPKRTAPKKRHAAIIRSSSRTGERS